MIEIIIATLATYGISTLLTSYDGPNDIFLRLRTKFPHSPLKCTACTAVWVSIPVFIVFMLGFGIWLLPFAMVGVAIILDRLT